MLRLVELEYAVAGFSLAPVSFSVSPGCCHVIVGPSGSGKTTLLELIVGLRKPRKGEVFWNDTPVTAMAVEKRNFGYLPQKPSLFPHLSVYENILYGLRIRGKPTAAELAYVDHLLAVLTLEPLRRRSVHDLSGGEAQRVGLARALAPSPRLLLLDEPFASLDYPLRRELWSVVRRLVEEKNTAVILVTHDVEEALSVGDTLHVLHEGRILQSGTAHELVEYPHSLTVARMFGMQNIYTAYLLSSHDGTTVCRCPAWGKTFSVPSDMVSHLPGSGEQEVYLGVRSECVRWVNKNAWPQIGCDHAICFDVCITQRQRTRTGYRLTLQIRDTKTPLEMLVGIDGRGETDDEAEVQVPLSALRWFGK
jgi:ABC-type Fe3+/spermidine/putrescine transport system ATPase subunit